MSEPDPGMDSLLDTVIDGQCDEIALRQFQMMLRDSPQARSAYLDQIRIHALLEWRYGCVKPGLAPRKTRHCSAYGMTRTRARMAAAGAAVFLLGSLGLWAIGHGRSNSLATLVEVREVKWDTSQEPMVPNARVPAGPIRWRSGTLRFAFDSGALVSVEGPADLRIESAMRLKATRGRITTRVRNEARGFTIETPSTLVVDQGTEFGVAIEESGQTGVVVFEGRVDLSLPKSANDSAEIKRLVQGEGLRVGMTGDRSRIVEVTRQPGADVWSIDRSDDNGAVIRSVSDNVRGLESAKYYQIVKGGFQDDVPAYVDRPYEWNALDPSGFPSTLQGADYIMTFNNDKDMTDLEIFVELRARATLFVLMDSRLDPPPWLVETFTNTDFELGMDECWRRQIPDGDPKSARALLGRGPGNSIDKVFSVWKREIAHGQTVTLGPLPPTDDRGRSMYGIAAIARH